MEGLQVIADDLTGACDVAASLLPWPRRLVVHPDGGDGGSEGDLAVRNTQSRTLAPDVAATRVRAALRRDGAGIVLKKIDTGLRGPLGAEIDAAMDAVGAARAFVLPAIPEVGRTTVGGEQLIGGVPVHRTAFAHDPQNPVRDAAVTAAIARTSRRAIASVFLEAVRRSGGPAAAIDDAAAPIVVLDAETDADLATSVRALLAGPRPLLLVGSTGLARALRGRLAEEGGRPGTVPAPWPAGGVLVVVGSAHPSARAQCRQACRSGVIGSLFEVGEREAQAVGRAAADALGAGATVALVAPGRMVPGREIAMARALREATLMALAGGGANALLLVGGETAYEVLAGLGHPVLAIEGRAAPLAVRASIAEGDYCGLPVITKGGSSGDDGLLERLLHPDGVGGP